MEIAPFASDEMLLDFYVKRRRSTISYIRAILRRFAAVSTAKNFDLLWIEKELFPYLPSTAEYLLPQFGNRYVVDYDDAVFHNYDQHRSWLVRRCLSRKIANVMRFSDCVLAGNNYLAAYARSVGARRIEYVPTGVSTSRYVPKTKAPNDRVRVGWIGSPATTRYLSVLREVVGMLGSDASSFQFVAVGGDARGVDGNVVRCEPWTEETEVEQIQSFDIGIMPLTDGLPERGKCGYKLIQYMACGLPVIASPIGVNAEIVQDGVNGFLADTPAEWVGALKRLGADFKLRQNMGTAGRFRVEREFATEVLGPRLLGILKSIQEMPLRSKPETNQDPIAA